MALPVNRPTRFCATLIVRFMHHILLRLIVLRVFLRNAPLIAGGNNVITGCNCSSGYRGTVNATAQAPDLVCSLMIVSADLVVPNPV